MQRDSVKRLAATILEQALKDYKTNRGYLFNNAKRWFEDESRDVFGFFWCLEYSEINPNLVRKYLKECDERNRQKHRTQRSRTDKIITII